MIRKIIRSIKYLIIFVLSLIAIVSLIFVVANWRDDELRPEVKQAMDWQVPANAFDKDNGYLLLHGMYAPLGQDPYETGKLILVNELARYQTMRTTLVEPPIFENTYKDPFANWWSEGCKYTETKNSVDFYTSMSPVKFAELIEAQKPFLARFNALMQAKKFMEVHPPMITYAFPPMKTLGKGAEQIRMQAAKDFANGKREQGVKRLLESNQFARRLLRDSNTLVMHMVALSMLQKDTRFMSELMVKYPESANQYQSQISEILTPLTGELYSLAKIFRYERKISLSLRDSIEYAAYNSGNWFENVLAKVLGKIFYLPNAMQNIFYDISELRIALAVIDASKYDYALQVKLEKEKELLGFEFPLSSVYLRNPIGKILASIPASSYYHYIERQHDLDGFLTLTRLQQKIIADKVTKDQLPKVLPNYPNPYTQQLMRLDAEKGMIFFDGRHVSNSNFERSKINQIAMPQ